MTGQTNEQALESVIEKSLTWPCYEDIKDQGIAIYSIADFADPYKSGNRYFMGSPKNCNAKFAIDEHHFWRFLETTQKEKLAKLQKQNDCKRKILERLDRLITKDDAFYLAMQDTIKRILQAS